MPEWRERRGRDWKPAREEPADNRPQVGDDRYGYGGQEYGLEGPHGVGRPDWGLDPNDERNRNFDRQDPGVGQSSAGYAVGPAGKPGKGTGSSH